MSQQFYDRPVLNSPYEYPGRHWKLRGGLPTDEIVESRRVADFVSPVPPSKSAQPRLALGDERLSTSEQQYNPYPLIQRIRREVDCWRELPKTQWGVTPETKRLLRHWRSDDFRNLRPFFCQVEAAETAIWLVEVAGALRESPGNLPKRLRPIWEHLREANAAANPEVFRIALKMATGAGKTTVMAMLIAWQTVNAARHPGSSRFASGFLVVTPGITIRDRLRVLLPEDPENYYRTRELVPRDLLPTLGSAKIVITNFHAFQRREKLKLSKAARGLLKPKKTQESEGEMLGRVMGPLLGKGRVIVLNDEGHHCYRGKPGAERNVAADEREEAKENAEAARVWISGIEALRRKLDAPVVFDLSATPFFLSGSGYAEGTLFPWTVSDFSLMDAIESGIVKLPRVPISDNVAEAETPKFRNLWEHIGKKMPKTSRSKGTAHDPERLPPLLETAADALYTHYGRVFEQWRDAGVPTPPVFAVVCNNTATSKLLYDYLAGYRTSPDEPWCGGFELFRNHDEEGNRLARPRTLLIDSRQLESGDALDRNFREAMKDEIERFRREKRVRGEDDSVTDADLLREAMNTIGKPGSLGADIRCVVSVSMLTEGWDARTVTHILGIRAFGTQLLCEQVVGRALRRQSYEPGADGLFAPEYADVLGIPFDFTGEPKIVTPGEVRPTVDVHAVRPDRDHLEIRFPQVEGYRIELPEDRLTADFVPDSALVLTPDLIGPTDTTNKGIVGLPVELRPERNQGIRAQTLAFWLARDLLRRHLRGDEEEPRFHLFGQARRIVLEWLEGGYLQCHGGTHRGQLLYETVAEMACEKIRNAITAGLTGEKRPLAVTAAYNPEGSTADVSFRTRRERLWVTAADKSHINYAACDSSWERAFCRVLEASPAVECYARNAGLGFSVPYRLGGEPRQYLPDFLVRLRSGTYLVVEIKGLRDAEDAAKADTMHSQWIPGVNNLGRFGRWAFLELRDPNTMAAEFGAFVDALALPGAA